MKIKELQNEALMKIIEEYYENKLTVKELLSKHGVEYGSNFIQTVTLYSEDVCEVCRGKVKYILESRTYCNSLQELRKKCSNCGHEKSDACSCKKCVEQRRIEDEKRKKEKRDILEKTFYEEPVSIDDLSIKELVFIGVLKEKSILYNLGILDEKDYFRNIYYYKQDRMHFLKDLLHNKIIKINFDDSNLESFKIEENGVVTYYPYLLSYNLNLRENLNTVNIKDKLIKSFSKEDLQNFWRDICLEECLTFLDIRTSAMKLGVVEDVIRKEITSLIEDILLEYSVGQVICIISRSVNYASNFKIEYDVEDIKVHKAIYTNIKNHILKQYNIINYNRPYELIPTTLNEYFCKHILELDIDEAMKKNNLEIWIQGIGTQENTLS